MTSPLVLDGGMGRELLRRGAPFRQPEWSALALIEAPHFVSEIHDDYIQAGADVITTNSYALVPFHIGDERFDRDGQALAALAGRLAREAADRAAAAGRKIIVAGSLPPVLGSYRPDLFEPAEAKRLLSVLIAGLSPYVDIWLAETQASLTEVRVLREALGADPRPLWLSFTLQDTKEVTPVLAGQAEPVLRSGETVRQAARAALDLGAESLLFNCSLAELMEPAIRAARDELRGTALADAVGAYANAFVPTPDPADKPEANAGLCGLRDDLSPGGYADLARSWIAAGASRIGGCCGIGPDHICEIHGLLHPGA
ncbi:homocysteine S-methyltransferase family protein [Xinfangfangia sp. D13-10-4-6]|uniref:homocysteine S-methyltransferase family protein n=1 Tax=Pseudogemmobacter hezensis TaxID=2737662 RepID=UPI0015576717|nr:homocysteine S-methyltransferase family protein [Pseudogemmobacter hezensis]NPD16101.1 homocysteine S-methyltransferase family protein [Pseudogemmobacter hezensis]